MKKEPALILSAILAALISGLSMLRTFGVDITPEQQSEIVTFAGAVGALVVGIYTRSLVTPSSKVVTMVSGKDVIAGPASDLTNGTVVDPNAYQPRRVLDE